MSECDYGLWVLDGVGGSRFLFLFFILIIIIIIIIYIQISLMGTCWSWSVATGNWVWFLGVCPNMIGLFGCFPTIIALGFHAPPTSTPPFNHHATLLYLFYPLPFFFFDGIPIWCLLPDSFIVAFSLSLCIHYNLFFLY